MKLYRKLHLTALVRDKEQASDGFYGSTIYKHTVIFQLRSMHMKGSTRPKGYYHDPIGSDLPVFVTWDWYAEHGYYAPKVDFRPCELSLQCMALLAPHLEKMTRGRANGSPTELLRLTNAMIVKSVEDEGDAIYDYRPIQRIGDPEMLVLAYAAL